MSVFTGRFFVCVGAGNAGYHQHASCGKIGLAIVVWQTAV